MSVVIVVADGARPDTLGSAMDRGLLPNLTRLREQGGMHTVSTCFPSVTGPAYAPFLMGRYPGPVGLPGLRWFDRTKKTARLPGHSRSYVGPELRWVDSDLEPAAPTMFELVPSSLAALNVIGRGLGRGQRLGRGVRFVARTASTHFRGDVSGWLAIDRDIGAEVADRIRRRRPEFVFAALCGIDKTSHAMGHTSARVEQAMEIVDGMVGQIRSDAERDDRWREMNLWVVSDHGHSPVEQHDDLAGFVRRLGFRTIAHPFVYSSRGQVAVMVSGNAMAHVYLALDRPRRPWWPSLGARWRVIHEALYGRESVDLMILPQSLGVCEVHGGGRGHALMVWGDGSFSYRPVTGDPLGTGECVGLNRRTAYDATIGSDYPDAFVQIASLVDSPRSGEIILSASRGWDFRAKYEPIPHVSSHGALHREHMLVPLLLNRRVSRQPRRTVDVMPSALNALGITPPERLDGETFL